MTNAKHTTAQTAAMDAAKPLLANGIYTVSAPGKKHVTLKVSTVRKGQLEGKRIISILAASAAEEEYIGVAFWDDAASVAYVWKKFRAAGSTARPTGHNWSEGSWSKTEKKLGLFLDCALRGDIGYWAGLDWKCESSRSCLVCNKTLTHPDSIAAGIGPVCASR